MCFQLIDLESSWGQINHVVPIRQILKNVILLGKKSNFMISTFSINIFIGFITSKEHYVVDKLRRVSLFNPIGQVNSTCLDKPITNRILQNLLSDPWVGLGQSTESSPTTQHFYLRMKLRKIVGHLILKNQKNRDRLVG